ncbi:hypothetical protein Z949_2407 [Sulfitobacter guttiformis KCTC 32187]|nr:hypothetical protein Z949_2407 [Sulfitobacter guttiformis KCTC 32187]
MQQRRHQMTDDQNGYICGAVIGAVMMEFLLADGTMIVNLQIPE